MIVGIVLGSLVASVACALFVAQRKRVRARRARAEADAQEAIARMQWRRGGCGDNPAITD